MLYGILMASTVTRSGRVSKKPERLDPEEAVEDDYSDDDDDDYSDDDEDVCETEDEDTDDDDDEDADENGNLKDFVVEDEDEDEEA